MTLKYLGQVFERTDYYDHRHSLQGQFVRTAFVNLNRASDQAFDSLGGPLCSIRDDIIGDRSNLLLRLHADDARREDMLPDRWAAAHPEAILTHRLDESRDKAARKREKRRRPRIRQKKRPR